MRTVLIALLALFTLSPLAASAESVVWNTTEQLTLCVGGIENARDPGKTFGCAYNGLYLDNPGISIGYNVRVINDMTGDVIPSGTTVPVETVVRYEFISHEYTDIYWFGTGGSLDSPYGDWVPGAARPSGSPFQDKNYYDGEKAGDGFSALYASLSVAPPTKDITGLDDISCTATANNSRRCTLTGPGTRTATFAFDATTGHFYLAKQLGGSESGLVTDELEFTTPAIVDSDSHQTYTLQIPQQTVTHTLTVNPPTGGAPSSPSLSSNGACIVGTPHTVTMSAIDPDGDSIRYGIDWNADGSIDEYVPPSGYMSSGTSQDASRTYATEGEKTVKVLAQDEGGLSSDWTTLSFNCADAPEEEEEEEDEQDQCSPAYICHGNNLFFRSGPQCAETFAQSCSYACSGGACLLPPGGIGNITATPSLVRTGQTSTINWTTSAMTACSVAENNPTIADAWTETNGTEQSSPITEQTIYTLSCSVEGGGTFTDTATINIVPVFQEN